MVKVKIYFFASIREKFGKKVLDFQVQKGSTVSQLISSLEQEFKLTSINDCMVAIDMEYVDKDYIIKKDEELSYDYGFGYDKDYKQFPCKCAAKNCCGYIVREGSRWILQNRKNSVNNFF